MYGFVRVLCCVKKKEAHDLSRGLIIEASLKVTECCHFQGTCAVVPIEGFISGPRSHFAGDYFKLLDTISERWTFILAPSESVAVCEPCFVMSVSV